MITIGTQQKQYCCGFWTWPTRWLASTFCAEARLAATPPCSADSQLSLPLRWVRHRFDAQYRWSQLGWKWQWRMVLAARQLQSLLVFSRGTSLSRGWSPRKSYLCSDVPLKVASWMLCICTQLAPDKQVAIWRPKSYFSGLHCLGKSSIVLEAL